MAKNVNFSIGEISITEPGGTVIWCDKGQVWNDLPYAGAVLIQEKLIELLAMLNGWGKMLAEDKGQGEMIKNAGSGKPGK